MTEQEQILNWIKQYKKRLEDEPCPAMAITLDNMIKNMEKMLDDHEY